MGTLIERWGDSAVVRIPAAIMAAASLSIGQTVEVREESGRVVIAPVLTPTYALEHLLADMTPETFPSGEDFGRPAGGELW